SGETANASARPDSLLAVTPGRGAAPPARGADGDSGAAIAPAPRRRRPGPHHGAGRTSARRTARPAAGEPARRGRASPGPGGRRQPDGAPATAAGLRPNGGRL